ncbi:MAG TPA: hypothetical protein VFZ22_10590 [Pyrinomonadaceae bacterium]|nr:hypothetical protein [Pyrinomonadaceae bacterium]
MATPEPLAELPRDITSLTSMIPGIGSKVTAVSVDRWPKLPGLAEINYLRLVKLDWRINFSKTKTSVFFFFRRRQATWVMLAARVSLNVRAASPLEPRPAPAIDDIRRLVRFPSFFWVDPSAEEIQMFGPPGATKENTVFFKLGSGRNILAITNPELGKKATLRYSRSGIPGPVEPQDKKYSLAPFVDLTWTIRDWLAQGKPSSAAIQLTGAPSQDTPVHQIMTALLQAYVDSAASLAAPPANPLFVSYVLDGYEISLNLRVRTDGSLAEKKEEEAFRVVIAATTKPGPPPMTSVDLEPPDFLINGDLFDAFFSAFTAPDPLKDLADAVGVQPGFLRLFLARAKATAAIFRIARREKFDDDLLILSGELAGSPTTLVIKASFSVNAEKDPPSVELKNEPIRVLKIVGDISDPSAKIPFEFVEFYLLLASSLRHWLAALGRW